MRSVSCRRCSTDCSFLVYIACCNVVLLFSVISECYVPPPSDDHSYAHCPSTLRPAAPEPLHPSLFRHSTPTSSRALPPTGPGLMPLAALTVHNKAVIDGRLFPRCRILMNFTKHLLSEVQLVLPPRKVHIASCLILAHWPHAMKTCHPQNRYISYHNAVRWHAEKKFGEDRPCGF